MSLTSSYRFRVRVENEKLAQQAHLDLLFQRCWAIVLSVYEHADHTTFHYSVLQDGKPQAKFKLEVDICLSSDINDVYPQQIPDASEVDIAPRKFLTSLERNTLSILPEENSNSSEDGTDIFDNDSTTFTPEPALSHGASTLYTPNESSDDEISLSAINDKLDELIEESQELFGNTGIVHFGGIEGLTLTFHVPGASRMQLRSMLRTFEIILHGITLDPNIKISDLELCSTNDAMQLHTWNSLQPSTGSGKGILSAILDYATEGPSRMAVDAWDGNLSYKDLENLSSQLAEHLVERGLEYRLESPQYVPLLFEKSYRTVVAMVAVAKVGCAFVLLDPSQPLKRLQSICDQIQAPIVVCSASLIETAATLAPSTLSLGSKMDIFDRNIVPLPSKRCRAQARNHALYGVFTSGSTGRPKGITVDHDAFVSCAQAYIEKVGMNKETRTFQFASYAFDVSISDTLNSLLVGGCLCIPSDVERLQSVATCIRQLKPTWADLTPSLLRHLSLQDLHTIRTVVVSGEALPRDVVDSWGGQIRLINVYGPAECSVQSTMCTNVSTESPSNIGKAIVGATWIVDPSNHDKLRPIGAIGELLIEGPHLGRGYLGEPTKTQQAFIHAPVWLSRFREPVLCDHTTGERLYCTGDLVRYEADGSLRYIGRKDTQVKLRGQRIELEEIEHHLRESLPTQVEVAAEVISMHQNSAPAVTLVAFVTRRQEKVDSSSTLPLLKKPCKTLVNDIFLALEKMQKSIPEYMIPGLFLSASYIPLTPSGKVDRRRLREEASQLSMKEVKQYMVEEKVSHNIQTELTEKIASSFAVVLNVPIEDVSLHADFFALGGDSISAMRVVSHLRKAGYILETGDILRRRTIGKIAAAVKPASQLSVSTRPGPKSDIESGQAFQLSPIQQMFFTDSPNGENYFNQSFFVAVSRNVDMVDLRNAARALVGRHAMLRARFNRSDENIWTQRITQNIEESFLCREYKMHKRQDVNQIMNSIQRGFNLERGPIFSISLFRIQGEDMPYMFLNTHHAVIDLVSYRIILEDLEQHLCTGSFASHGPIPSFEWWCRLQADFAKEELCPRVALPKDVHINHDFLQKYWDLQMMPNTYGNAHFASLVIHKDVTNDILGRANDAFRTEPVELLNAALLHSFMLVFADREAPVMFNEGHGREPWDPSIDLSRTVGWFTTIWPIPVDMEQLNVNNILDLVRRVKDGRRQVPGKGFPYFASRYFNAKGQEQFQKHKMEIVFNFHGKFQQFERDGALLQQVPWEFDTPSDYGPETVLPGIIEITCAVSGGRFKLEFIYGKHLAHQERIQLWMSQCANSLEEMARQLTQTPAAVPTLVDFPLLNWGYKDLNQLQETVSGLGIRLCDVESVYPCLPTQVGILLSRAKESSLYQTGSILELKHRDLRQISIDTLHNAWERTIVHHAVLRTVMIPSDDLNSPFNNVIIKPKVIPVAFSTVRYQEFEDEALERASILNMIRKDSGGLSEQAFAPYRIKLYTSSKAQSVFCHIIFNHAIMDGWSSNVLLQDWVKEYNSVTVESPITTYNDYVSFVLQNPSSRTYWQEYLNGAESCAFPKLVDYGKIGSEDVYTVDIAFSYPADALRHFVITHGITIASLYHVAWALLLRIYCERDDILFGYATSGRDVPLPDIEKTVGMIANILPCRISISENCSILELLQEIQLDLAQATSHQHVSLVDLQHELNFNGGSLFNTAISIQRQEAAENESHTSDRELIAEEVDEIDPTEYDVMLNVFLTEGSEKAHLSCRSSALTPWRAKNVADTLTRILSQILSAPSKMVRDMSFLGERQESFLHEFDDKMPIAVDACVHDLIEQQTKLNPAAIAVDAWDGRLSYNQLRDKSSALAQRLEAMGCGVGTWIPLFFERSVWVAVAMLAAMKCGAGFVLLEPSLPLERLQGICDDTNSTLILTSKLLEQKAKGFRNQFLAIDAEQIYSQETVCHPKTRHATPTDPLYAIFTSGSTGNPKGVVIEHGSFASSAAAHAPVAGYTSETRALNFCSYAFDACILEILTTLIVGGCVCIPSEYDRWNDLPGAVTKLRANHLFVTPSMLPGLDRSQFPGLKTILLGGEKPSIHAFQQWLGTTRVISAYGPSECSVSAAFTDPLDLFSDPCDVGTPTGSRPWIIDSRNPEILVPIGATGELLLEGPIVGRGYLKNPQKTADAFISPPSWRERFPCYPKRKLYRTGDLAQYTRSGKIRIIGRKDTQVKLRGQRIELGEIECALYNILPSYAHIFVELISQEENAESTMLVAILNQDNAEDEAADATLSNKVLLGKAAAMSTLEAAPQGLVSEIKKRLSTRLPQFMIPSLVFNVARPPRTVGGKVDRRLLKHEAAKLTREQLHGGATRAAESLLDAVPKSNGNVMVDLLCKALGCSADQLQAHHNFFQIGGDSLRAMKLANLARTHDITLSVQDIFRAPLVSEIIQVGEITNKVNTGHTFNRGTTPDKSSTQDLNSSEVVTVTPFSLFGRRRARKIIDEAVKRLHIGQFEIEDIYPCTALQQGLMFLTMRNANAYIARSTYALPPHCALDQLKNAWKQVFDANPILRTRMIQTDAGVVQVVLRDHLQLVHGDNLMLHLASDRARPMGLNEPLLRVALITDTGETYSGQGKDESYMIITIHHALYDGWSEGLILEQLEAAYGGAVLAHRPFAPFIKYVEESKEHARKFWEVETAKKDCPKAVFPLPPSPSYQPSPGCMLKCSLDLTNGHTSSKFTLSTQLRLAWATVMQHFTSAATVVFGVTVHGRGAPVPGIEALTGPTLATIPCTVYFQPSDTIADMLYSVQDASMRSLPYEQFGLQGIQELNDDAAEACKFQSLLVVQPKSTSSKSVFLKPLADIEPDNSAASFDTYPLTLQCSILENEVELQATYDAHIIPKPLLQRVLTHFKHVFAELSYDTARRFEQINPINDVDRLQLNQWCEQLRSDQLPQSPLVHDLIARQCEAQPGETAVNAWDGDFSYHDIEAYASNLAVHLAQEGVKVNSIVPICFEKSKWLAVIILAVIKCGAAFVLLDPSSQPLQRMQLIIREVDAKLIITSPALLATTAQISGVRSILVAEDAPCFARSSTISPLYVEEFSDRTALYVIFTSGSTGKPKGVVIEHHGYSAGALSRSRITGLKPSSRVLQFASCTFDTFITDILDTLIAGACICIPSESARNSGLGQVAHDMGVTYADIVPSVARLISPQEIPTLETLVLSGESVTRNDVTTWYDKVRLCNLYGPAECSAVATGNVVSGLDPNPSNIGRGCGGICWVVNPADCDMLLPIGAIGELVIEGSIVGRGYLGQVSEDAASNFVDIAPIWRRDFALGEGKFRMYRTGDLVQYQEDGKLLFIGRKDNQVKLHGQRLELGDVEHHLRNAFPTSLDVVATISCAPKERLVAFVVMGDTMASDTTEGASDARNLQSGSDIITVASSAFQKLIQQAEKTLREFLPAYMVPTAFFPVRELPRTSSGKVDRKTLPQVALEVIRRDGLEWYTAARQKRDPSTEAGKILQSVWARVLDIDSSLIGAEDGFLALGGDSITAMRVAAMAASEGFHLSVPDLFQNVSLERLTTSSSPGSAATESIIWEKETAISLEMEMQSIQSAQNNLPFESNYLTDILLTGSTGRLGREVVKKLIGNPAVGKVHCVAVRNVDKLPVHEKIVVYIGDLSKPRLGMSEAEEANVLRCCQAIIHCGALVSFVQTYETMRLANVESTKYLASLALKKHMPFHFISTAGVGERGGQAAVEEVSAAWDKPPADQSDGYTTTKWASEIFLEKVNSRFGLDITIHRPSNIICAGDPEVDIVNNLLEYSRRMNAIPELNGWEGYFDFISAQSAASNIVETVLAVLKRIVETGQRDPRAVQYIHESGETVVSVDDLGIYIGAQDDRPLQKVDMQSWVNNAMKEGMESIVGDFLCNMAASGEQVILPLIKSSRQLLG